MWPMSRAPVRDFLAMNERLRSFHQFIPIWASTLSAIVTSTRSPSPVTMRARSAAKVLITAMKAVPYSSAGWPGKIGPSRWPPDSAITPYRAAASAA